MDVGETQLLELHANQAQYFFYLMRETWKIKVLQKVCSTDLVRTTPALPHELIQLPEAFCTTATT